MELTETKLTCRAERRLCNRVSGMLLIVVAIMYLAVTCTMLLQAGIYYMQAGLHGATPRLETLLAQLTESGAGYLLYCVLCLGLLRLWKGRDFYPQALRSVRPMTTAAFFQLLAVFMAAQVLSTLFDQVLEALLNLWGLSAVAALEAATLDSTTPTMLLYGCVGAPIVEELVFRGAVLRSFQPFGKRFAIVISAALFGLFHGNLVQIPFAFLVGLVLGYVAVEYSLLWSIFLHFINNCVFSELLSYVPWLQNLLIVALFLAGCAVLIFRGNDMRAYHRSLLPMPKQALLGFLTAPCTIVLILLCLLTAVLGITVL